MAIQGPDLIFLSVLCHHHYGFRKEDNRHTKYFLRQLLRTFRESHKKWYFVTTIVLTVRNNCPCDLEKLLKFEAEDQEFAKC